MPGSETLPHFTLSETELKSRAVRRELNNVRNEGAELLAPAPVQGDL